MLSHTLAVTVGIAGAMAQITGPVSFTLPATIGACGRVCNGTITCKPVPPYDLACSGADAAVPYHIFFANYNASLPTNENPICGHTVGSVGALSTVTGTICGYCTEDVCGSNGLLLSDPAGGSEAGIQVGLWIL